VGRPSTTPILVSRKTALEASDQAARGKDLDGCVKVVLNPWMTETGNGEVGNA
jgi:hypothetical protein